MKLPKPIKPVVVVIKSERVDKNGLIDKNGKFIRRTNCTVHDFKLKEKKK